MPRGPSIKPEVESLCYQAWQLKRPSILNKAITIQKVFDDLLPVLLKDVKEEDRPGLSWFTKRINDPKKGWEVTSQNQPMAPDPIVKEWDEEWWKSPRWIYVLTTIYDQASKAVAWAQSDRNAKRRDSEVYEFTGFTDRVCRWAWKLSEFFDLNVSHQCSLLILIANLFAYEERKKLEYPEKIVGQWMKPTISMGIDIGPGLFPLGRDHLKAWQHYKQGFELTVGEGTPWLFPFDTEEMWRAIADIVRFGQTLIIVANDWETDEPSISLWEE